MKSPRTHRRPLRLGLLLVVACAWLVAAAPPVRAQDPGDLLVVEDDGTILEPAHPMPLAGRVVRFLPERDGGYRTALGEVPADTSGWRSGEILSFAGSTSSVRVALPFSFPFFDGSHAEIFVHPHGAVSLGRPLPSNSRAQAWSSGDLLRSLTAGPPVVAALWNELSPSRAAARGGVFIEHRPDHLSVAWVDVPSARPAGEPNSFRLTLHADGRIDLEYAKLASRWGIAGISPGRDGERTELADLATGPRAGARQALLAWYRDLPTLNEMALSRAVYRRLPDRFQFLTVFTNQPVDGPSLVGSVPVKNEDRGIGLPVFDHGELFGSHNLEHVVVMNDVAFYDEDPAKPPRHPAYAFAPSTLSVLAHETGHRWLAEASCSSGALAPGEGHWSFFVQSSGSFLGGNDLRDNADGTFTTLAPLRRFGPLDQYLMGLLPPEEVKPFFVVEDPTDFQPPRSSSGQLFDAHSKPESGVRFRGARRTIAIDDVIAVTGERSPRAGHGPRAFRMAFVLVVPAGTSATQAEVAKVDRIRHAFGPFFQEATNGRARMGTTLPRTVAPSPPGDDPGLRAGEPRVLEAEVRPRGGDRLALKLEFADFDADVTGVELTTDASAASPPTAVDVTSAAFGSRVGALVVNVRGLAADARELRLSLVDRRGRRSPLVVRPLPVTRL